MLYRSRKILRSAASATERHKIDTLLHGSILQLATQNANFNSRCLQTLAKCYLYFAQLSFSPMRASRVFGGFEGNSRLFAGDRLIFQKFLENI